MPESLLKSKYGCISNCISTCISSIISAIFCTPLLWRAMKSFIMPVSLAAFWPRQPGHWLSPSISQQPAYPPRNLDSQIWLQQTLAQNGTQSQLKSHICPALGCWEVFFLRNAREHKAGTVHSNNFIQLDISKEKLIIISKML